MESLFTFSQFPEMETPRLFLRETRDGDALEIFQILSNPKVIQFYNIGPLSGVEEARALVDRRRAAFAAGARVRWTIALKENGRAIGSCGYVDPDWSARQAEIGYELDPAHWGQGLMREALGAMLTFGFNAVGLNRVEANVVPENDASRRLLSALGFQQEGLLRERGYWKGAFHDLALYALLRRDWRVLAEGE